MKQTENLPDYEAAKTYALEQLERKLSPTICYHTLWHTEDEVAPRVEWLAHRENLGREATLLCCTAAYYHDIGFIRQVTGHEIASSEIAAGILPDFGFSWEQIRMVQGIILATRFIQSPSNLLEQIVADADLDVLGRADYLARNGALRAELAFAGIVSSDAVWYRRQSRFLRNHRYFTATAREQRARGKQLNLAELQTHIDGGEPQPAEPLIFTASPNLISP